MAASPQMTGRGRDLGIDVARGMALLAMFVAHFAPSNGPGDVLILSEFVTAPLFAFLIGWGSMLGRGRQGEWTSVAVRAATLIGLGLLLDRAGAQIVIVLVWLGVLTGICVLLVRLPDLALGALAIGLLLLAPMLNSDWATRVGQWKTERFASGRVADGFYPWLVDLVFTGSWYRMTDFVLFAVVGILLARHTSRRVTVSTTAIALAVAAVLAVADYLDAFDVVPYDSSHQVLIFNVGLVVAVTQIARLAAAWRPAILKPLARVGSMTLTIYTIQIYAAALWVHGREPGFRDNSWALIALLVAASFALAWIWPRAVRRTPWSRGPIEGPVRALSSRLSKITSE